MTESVSYFDCNLCIGAPVSGGMASCRSVAEAAQELDWAGVDQALLWHALMRAHSPVVGNRILWDELRAWREGGGAADRFVGTAALLPPQTGELDTAAIVGAIEAGTVGALWALFPQEHRYLLNRLTFGPFLDEISEKRVPLFVPRDAGGPQPGDTWQMLTALLAEYPHLRLVVAHHGPWGEDRFFRPLLDRYDRLYLDLSRYELDLGLSQLVSRYGASRFLYGSHYPFASMGGPRMMVARAEIDDAARAAVAGGNLRRLLAEVVR